MVGKGYIGSTRGRVMDEVWTDSKGNEYQYVVNDVPVPFEIWQHVSELEAELYEILEDWRIQTEALNSTMAENQRLREALHEIYSKACQAMSEDDYVYLYSFARDARDIALNAHKAQAALLEGE